MLIALMTILLMGGSSSAAVLAHVADTQGAVNEIVADEQRREDALLTLKQLKEHLQQQDKAGEDIFKTLTPEILDHAASESEIDAIWTQFYEHTREANAETVEFRFKLREQLTREEWGQVFQAER